MFAHVIEIEGPVRKDMVAKCIARVHGWARSGKRIKDRVLALALNEYPVTEEDVGRFFWPKGNDACEWSDICYGDFMSTFDRSRRLWMLISAGVLSREQREVEFEYSCH